MQVRRRHSARCSHRANWLALANLLPGDHVEPGQVSVVGFVTVTVIDDHQPAISAKTLGEYNDAVRGRIRRRTHGSRDIDACVISAFTREWIGALAVAAHESSVHRPVAWPCIDVPAPRKTES